MIRILKLSGIEFDILASLSEGHRRETMSRMAVIEDERADRRLTRCHINTYCKFCKSLGFQKVKCTHRAKYRAFDHKKHFACAVHRNLIEDTDPTGAVAYSYSAEGKAEQRERDRKQAEIDRKHGYSEADYQTWMRV